jgi:hypothetical protein
MEGTIDLVQAFGTVPTNLYLCSAAYITTNGGPCVGQCPAGSGANIDTNGFFVIPTIALRDNNADGKFDRLDPALDFTFQAASRGRSAPSLNWATMPRHAYQLLSADSLALIISATAGPVQLFISYTDAPPPSVTQRLYRAKLLP